MGDKDEAIVWATATNKQERERERGKKCSSLCALELGLEFHKSASLIRRLKLDRKTRRRSF